MVRRLVRERAGFMFTSLWAPHGSAAATEPLRDDNLRGRARGLWTGLRSGVGGALILQIADNVGNEQVGDEDLGRSIEGSRAHLGGMRDAGGVAEGCTRDAQESRGATEDGGKREKGAGESWPWAPGL